MTIDVYTYTCIHITTINEKICHKLECKERYMELFERKKGQRKLCYNIKNKIKMSKNKEEAGTTQTSAINDL